MKISTKTVRAETADAIETCSGNVFVDLGLAGPDERQLRV